MEDDKEGKKKEKKSKSQKAEEKAAKKKEMQAAQFSEVKQKLNLKTYEERIELLYINFSLLWFPKLNISHLRFLLIAALVPLMMSSMYVKSLFMFPSLKTEIGLPDNILLVKINIAISGRPHGPYTVK